MDRPVKRKGQGWIWTCIDTCSQGSFLAIVAGKGILHSSRGGDWILRNPQASNIGLLSAKGTPFSKIWQRIIRVLAIFIIYDGVFGVNIVVIIHRDIRII